MVRSSLFRKPFLGVNTFIRCFTTTRATSVCIIGSGPAGFYCAQNLLKILPSCVIDIYDKLPVPFGLVRFGVAPDHPEVKNVINNFSKVASDPRVSFIGNVSLGSDVKLAHFRRAYDVVILSYGADQDIELKIPGENLSNVISARRFVGWYNGLPADRNIPIDLSAEDVTIFGQGNVAIDVARILLKSVDDLKTTDITEHSLAQLAESKVKTVRLIGRRGLLQVAFTIKEFREISKLPHVRTVIDYDNFEGIAAILSELPRPRRRLTELLMKTASESRAHVANNKTLHIAFLRSPVKFVGNENVKGVELVVNRFKNSPFSLPPETQPVESTDTKDFLPTKLSFRSIGYRCSKLEPEIPFNNSNCTGSTRILPGVYCAGWLNTGPVGVILTTMTDAFNTANHILEDVQNNVIVRGESKPGYELIKPILREKGIPVVSWEGWKTIDEVEVNRGKDCNKPREKLVDVDEMLSIVFGAVIRRYCATHNVGRRKLFSRENGVVIDCKWTLCATEKKMGTEAWYGPGLRENHQDLD